METSKKGTVVAIGNFDGVHKGHAALIAHAKSIADTEGRELVALTFEPHPRSFFRPDDKPFRITPEHVKERRLKMLGVNRVEILDFNEIMSKLSPAMFIDIMLVDLLNASHVVVGSDFQFGRNREGTIRTLEADKRFKTDTFMLLADNAAPVSSTRVRDALYAGDMALANTLLGWDWEIEGEVIQGDKRGRELGYPTANMLLEDTLCPAHGIYAVRVEMEGGKTYGGAAAIGLRPMFAVKAPLLEVYVFDFDGDLYGKTLRVRPVRYIRPEAKFDSIVELTDRMKIDCEEARRYLG